MYFLDMPHTVTRYLSIESLHNSHYELLTFYFPMVSSIRISSINNVNSICLKIKPNRPLHTDGELNCLNYRMNPPF